MAPICRSAARCKYNALTVTCVVILVQLNELMDPENGFLGREGLILRVDVLECCPWFEFADLETYTSGAALEVATPLQSSEGYGKQAVGHLS